MKCRKYDIVLIMNRANGCSKQFSAFDPQICENCFREAEKEKAISEHRPEKKPLIRGLFPISNRVKGYRNLYQSS